MFVSVNLQCVCLPGHKLAKCMHGCVYHARRYSAISHRAGVMQSDLECERCFAHTDSNSVTKERLHRIILSL